MEWTHVAALCASLAFVCGALWICLPFFVKRSDAETRIAALEAANEKFRAEFGDRLARVEQALTEMYGPRGLPRVGGRSVG